MAPIRQPFPPSHHQRHLDRPLNPQQAADNIAKFLAKSASQPHLHPDSLLTTAGVKFAPQSGPNGGLALHHLRRIERGLRGENLIPETKEELARFGDEELRRNEARMETVGESGKGKRKRSGHNRLEEIEEWAESSSQATRPGEWQDREEWEAAQQPVEGDVGDREGAPMVKEGGSVPGIEEHDSEGRAVVREKKTKKDSADGEEDEDRPLGKARETMKTDADKAARKAAKKARKKAKRQEIAMMDG